MEPTITQENHALIPEKRKRKREETRRIAWVVMITSFIVFCTICASSSFGVYYFLFQSNVAASASVKVSNRGTVGLVSADLQEQFEFDRQDITRGDTVLTDPQSQAVISFRDMTQGAQVFAAVTLKNDSELVVQRMTQPRFEWSGRSYQISLMGRRGEFDVLVPQNLPRQVDMNFSLPNDTIAHIGQAGRYTITLSETAIRVETRDGQAALLPPDRNHSRAVNAGQVGVYEVERDEIVLSAGNQQLVANHTFEELPENTANETDTSLPVFEAWNCADQTEQEPFGAFHWEIFEGRPTMHFLRGGGAESNGRTICVQPFPSAGQVGQPVTDYDYLALRTTFYIESHSLNLCGTLGSECPLMLRIDYVDESGDGHDWIQGFYAKLDPGIDYPPQCASCLQEHKRVNANVWFTYESGNLFTLLPQDRKPASILNVRFYAEGHEYDVYVSEMSLLAGPAMATAE